MARPVVAVAERRIPGSIEAVWSVITDPKALERIEPRARLVETTGVPGQVGSRYKVVMFGVPMERVVAEAVVGERLVLHSVSRRDGSVLSEQTGTLRDDGDAVVLTWAISQSPLPLVGWVSALTARRALARWLSKVEREVTTRAG